MSEIALRYPMRLDGRGVVITTYSADTIWADRVRVLLSTYKSERSGDVDYGTNVDEALFAGMGMTSELVAGSIEQAIAEYLPELEDVSVDAAPMAYTDTSVEVVVYFRPPNANQTSVTTALNIESLVLNGQ